MLFPTVEFAIFFPVVLALSWALMSRPSIWKPFIVTVSYLFYASANWKFCLLITAVIVGNQAGASLSLPLPLLTIALPVGISFFTFQAISYVVDVKRELIEPSPVIDLAIYLS